MSIPLICKEKTYKRFKRKTFHAVVRIHLKMPILNTFISSSVYGGGPTQKQKSKKIETI